MIHFLHINRRKRRSEYSSTTYPGAQQKLPFKCRRSKLHCLDFRYRPPHLAGPSETAKVFQSIGYPPEISMFQLRGLLRACHFAAAITSVTKYLPKFQVSLFLVSFCRRSPNCLLCVSVPFYAFLFLCLLLLVKMARHRLPKKPKLIACEAPLSIIRGWWMLSGP